MKILCIETSSTTESIALTDGTHTAASFRATRPKGHGSDLLRDIENALSDAAWNWQDLDGFAVGLGPGGFTSLRIGLATAKTLAYSLKKPLYGISTIEILRHEFTEEHCVPLIDAKRSEVYVDVPGKGLLCLSPLTLDDYFPRDQALFFCGDGAARYETELRQLFPKARFNENPGANVPNAEHLSQLIKSTDPAQIATLQPLYVRPSDAEITYPDGFPDAVTQFKL